MKINHHEQRQAFRLVVAGYLVLLSFTSAYGQNTRAADERTLRDLDAQWSAAAGAKDVDKTVSYYSEDAIVLPPNAPSATTKEAIRSVWKDLLTSPGVAVSWTVTKVEVAQGGDMAHLIGTYEVTMSDASGKPVNDRGKYLEVMKKQADGKWKCMADIWNSDLPAPTPLEKK